MFADFVPYHKDAVYDCCRIQYRDMFRRKNKFLMDAQICHDDHNHFRDYLLVTFRWLLVPLMLRNRHNLIWHERGLGQKVHHFDLRCLRVSLRMVCGDRQFSLQSNSKVLLADSEPVCGLPLPEDRISQPNDHHSKYQIHQWAKQPRWVEWRQQYCCKSRKWAIKCVPASSKFEV